MSTTLDPVMTTWLQGYVAGLRDGSITDPANCITKLMARGHLEQLEFDILMELKDKQPPSVVAEVLNDYFFGGVALLASIAQHSTFNQP